MSDYQAIERVVIGATMLNSGHPIPPEVLAVEPEHFTNAKDAMIWSVILDLIANRKPHDPVSVFAAMETDDPATKGTSAYLLDLEDEVPTTANLGHWAKVVVESGERRLLEHRIRGTLTAEADSDTVMDRVEAAMSESKRKGNRGGGLVHVKEPLRALLAELEEEYKNPEGNRIAKTGIPDLDVKAELRAGELTIIAGRPSMGKSALAMGIAGYCARDITRGSTCLFSLEMSATSLLRRVISAEVRADSRQLARKCGQEELTSAFAKTYGLDLWIDDRGGIGVPQIRASLSRLPKVRLVVVDYLQLAATDPDIERHDLRLGALTKGLKRIAKEWGCHVIALSQLNRSVEQRKPPRPCIADLRDSGNLEEDADNVWLLYRPGYYDPRANQNEAEVIIGKARNGPVGSVTVGWSANRQQFYGVSR